MTVRKITQISTAHVHHGKTELAALCDDGTVWAFIGGEWIQLPNVPQPQPEPVQPVIKDKPVIGGTIGKDVLGKVALFD